MTPTGVEHFVHESEREDLLARNDQLTPTGVEHLAIFWDSLPAML
jgi:hypothetical protein